MTSQCINRLSSCSVPHFNHPIVPPWHQPGPVRGKTTCINFIIMTNKRSETDWCQQKWGNIHIFTLWITFLLLYFCVTKIRHSLFTWTNSVLGQVLKMRLKKSQFRSQAHIFISVYYRTNFLGTAVIYIADISQTTGRNISCI